jgi:hypothetical protein
MTKECWLFLDCQVMTGYPADRCPNWADCKQNALHTDNRYCWVPYEVFDFNDHRELMVMRAREPEHKTGGWANPCGIPYLWNPGELIVGGMLADLVGSVDEEAEKYGYAAAIKIPYSYDPDTKELKVEICLTKAHQEAGWGRAVLLPYQYDLATKTLEVSFVWAEVENKNAIAAGWHSAELIEEDLPW